ncbi:MAG: hypothetical protein AAF602_32055, partial [Myxococcota bacterium]
MLAVIAFPLLVVGLARFAVSLTHDGRVPAWVKLLGWSGLSFASLAAGRTFEASAADLFLVLKFVLVCVPLVALYVPSVRQRWRGLVEGGVPVVMAVNMADAIGLDLF